MSFCGSCGKKNTDGARFCVECGSPINSVPEQSRALADRLNLMWVKKYRKWIIGVVGVLIVLVGVVVLNRPAKPEDVAESFMEALKNNNFTKAYSYIYLPEEREFLSKGFFIKAMENRVSEEGVILGYKINFKTDEEVLFEGIMGEYLDKNMSDLIGQHFYIVDITRKQTRSYSLDLYNVGTSRRPEWKVDMHDLFDKYQIKLPFVSKKMEIKIDGKTVPLVTRINISTFMGAPIE